MDLDRPLAVVAATVDADVLAALARAESAFTPGQLHRLIGRWSEPGVRKSLSRLVEQGVVRAQRAGNAYLYSLNRQHLAAPAIIELARLKEALLARLRHVIASWPVPPRYAAIYGSAARGDMTPASDIDLFVVRPAGVRVDDLPWREAVDALGQDLTAWTGNDARVLEYDEEQVQAAGDPIVRSVRAEGLRIVGSADVFSLTSAPQVVARG